MSGILDQKSRIMDTIVTLEGRRQISSSKLKIEYLSFTDASTHYRPDVHSGSADASARLYFEQSHLPQDQITFEADDSGRLSPFGNSEGTIVKDGQILGYSFNAITSSTFTGQSQNMTIINGNEFASTSETMLASSIDNFTKLRIIGTKNKIFEDDGFSLGNSKIKFVINNHKPIADQTTHVAHVNHLESLFQDIRLSKIQNFKYLPPINKVENESIDRRDHRKTSKYHLGNYKPWGRSHLFGLSAKQLENELRHFERSGYSRTVVFEPTSIKNKLMAQFFELNSNVMRKLDVIDFGTYSWKGNLHHAFFAGKIYNDENGTPTFVHMFTLVFG